MNRLRALDSTKEDMKRFAEQVIMKEIENERTSQVVFGSQTVDKSDMESRGWKVTNPVEFLRQDDYFDTDKFKINL